MFLTLILTILLANFSKEELLIQKLEPFTLTPNYRLNKCFKTNGINSTEKIVDCKTKCIMINTQNRNQIDTNLFQSGCTTMGCYGDSYYVRLYSIIQFKCCLTDLCNSKQNYETDLNYDCEFNKVPANRQKLIIPIRDTSKSSVKKCYYCERCTVSTRPVEITCKSTNSRIKDYACQVTPFR